MPSNPSWSGCASEGCSKFEVTATTRSRARRSTNVSAMPRRLRDGSCSGVAKSSCTPACTKVFARFRLAARCTPSDSAPALAAAKEFQKRASPRSSNQAGYVGAQAASRPPKRRSRKMLRGNAGSVFKNKRPWVEAGRLRVLHPRRKATIVVAACCVAILAALGGTASVGRGAVAPTGQGFTVTAGDLSFILKQIKISEHHAATATASNQCGTLVGPGPYQIPDRLTPYGLRTVDGSCNNLFPDREKFATADQPFPRLTSPVFRNAEGRPAGFFGPGDPGSDSSSYAQKLAGNLVYDSQPRVISNLIVDQTSTNPAAIAAAGFPVRSQNNPGLFPCTTEPGPDGTGGVPENCVPAHHTLFIPNVTTDVGLSPPYNSLFTFFGQFFDHGVDQTVKSGATVFVPLH